MSNQDEMMGKRQDAAQGEVAPLQKLASYPLEEFAKEGKPSNYPLFAANDWKLTVGDVLAARAAITTPTPSAETIDTPEFRRLACDLIDGGGNDCEELFALIAHINARMAAARQEGYDSQRARVLHIAHERDVARCAAAADRYELEQYKKHGAPTDDATHPAPAAGLTEALRRIAQLEEVVRSASYDLTRIHDAMGFAADDDVDADRIIAAIAAPAAGIAQQPAQAAGYVNAGDLESLAKARDERGKVGDYIRMYALDDGNRHPVFATAARSEAVPAQAGAVPEGFVLAPSKQTPEMLLATISCRNDEQCLCRWRPVADDGTIQCEGCAEQCAEEYEANIAASPLATHEGKAGGVETPEIVVIAAARALADRHAAACNVDKDDNWKIYGDEFIADARAALAAMQAQQAGKAGA